ncbi:STAS domain-containing protein [Endozoicomonas sp. Mp262]|uniref:STAS domain-containing protein n=1 Tax=Endozoicomonas sp. Mp262 TaxID=2919499 RepID=UPI0021D8FF45
MALTINLEEHHSYILFEIIGKIDAYNAKIVAAALNDALYNSHKHLLLECSQLQSINSKGLQQFLATRRQMPFFRTMLFCNPISSIASLFELSGITQFIPVIPDIIEAEALLQELDVAQGHIASQQALKYPD